MNRTLFIAAICATTLCACSPTSFGAEPEEQLRQFDYSILDVPEGKDAAFYDEYLIDALAAVREYTAYANKNNLPTFDLDYKCAAMRLRCDAYKALAPDFNRHESPESELLYALGQAYLGNIEFVEDELDAELDKEGPDQDRAHALREYLELAKLSRLLRAKDVPGLEAHIDAAIDDFVDNEDRRLDFSFYLLIGKLWLLDGAELADAAETHFIKRCLESESDRLRTVGHDFGKKRLLKGLNKEFKFEGVCTDGSELSWDDYRGKPVLIVYIPAVPAESFAEQELGRVLEAYRLYRQSGFEVVGYTARDQETWAEFEKKVSMPWKTVSQELSRQAEDEDYLDIEIYYGLVPRMNLFFIGKDGKLVKTSMTAGESFREWLAKEFPKETQAELERILDVPKNESVEFYEKRREELEQARSIMKSMATTSEDAWTTEERLSKAFGALNENLWLAREENEKNKQ